MKRFQQLGTLSAIAMCLLFTGCGKGVAELTSHEEDMIITYISGAVSKANTKHPQGLTYLYESDQAAEEQVVAEQSQEGQSQEGQNVQTEEGDASQTTDATESTKAEETIPAETLTSTLTDVLSMPSITAEYKDYSLHKNYMVGDYFALNAKEGKTYLVVNVALTNTSQEEVTCNILEKDLQTSILVNGEKAADVMPTILLHDFSTYIENIAPASTEDAILIFEVEEDTVADIQTLGMEVLMEGTTYRIALK